jgi:hypothetical protein
MGPALRLLPAAFVLGISLLLAAADPAAATLLWPRTPIRITAPRTIEIRGELESGDLTGSLRLRATSSAVPASAYYFLIREDLTDEKCGAQPHSGKAIDPAQCTVGREHVQIADPTDLPPGGARDHTITVSGLTHAGTYTSTIQILQATDARKPLATVMLKIVAERRPAPRVVTGTPVHLAFSQPFDPERHSIHWWVGVAIALLLIILVLWISNWPRAWPLRLALLAGLTVALLLYPGPAGLAKLDDATGPWLGFNKEIGVDLDNPRSAELPVEDGRSYLRRTFDGRAEVVDLRTAAGRPLTDWDATIDRTLLLQLSSDDRHPGHYTGELLLELQRTDNRFAIPVELDVKVGPLVPLLILILSILVGYAIRLLVRRIFPGYELQADLDRLQSRIDKELTSDRENASVAEGLVILLLEGRRLTEAGDRGAAHKRSAVVKSMLDTWKEIRSAEDNLPALKPPQRTEARRLLKQAKAEWRANNADGAIGIVNQLQARLWTWKQWKPRVAIPERPQPTVGLAFSDRGIVMNAAVWEGRTVDFDWAGRSRRMLPIARFVILWVTRPIFYGVLVFVLAIVALKLLYLENPTFGAHLTDWFPLIGWGVATDPVSTALSNLRGNAASQ